MSATILELLDTVRAHLASVGPAGVFSVTVYPSMRDHQVRVLLTDTGGDLARLASALVAWAETLGQVTAQAWRTRDGHSVHLSVTGRLSNGATAHFFSGVAYAEQSLSGALEPGASTPVVLAALRHAAESGTGAS